MMVTTVTREQRFKKWGNHCPICEGHSGIKQGIGERCTGYESTDGEYVYCQREQYAGSLPLNEKTTPPTFCHKMYGPCNCGIQHNPPHASTPPKRKIIAEYDYRDAQGQLIYQAVRFAPKEFSQRRPTPGGKWEWNMKGVEKVLYQLPALLAAPRDKPVYIVEGEKDVATLRTMGLLATCNVGGAATGETENNKKWLPSYSETLRNRHIIILPDNDVDGQAHAKTVSESLSGIAASLKIINLPGLPEKGDVSDWAAAGGTRKKLEALVDVAAAAQKPRVTMPTISRLCDLQEEILPETKWAIPDIWPAGLTLLVGKPKLGKSWLLLAMMLGIAQGTVVMGNMPVESGEVLYIALEDNKKRLQKRTNTVLSQAKASPNFYYTTAWSRLNDGGLEQLEEWILTHPQTRAIGIDTWAKVKPKAQGHGKQQYDEDYDALTPLQELASKHGVAIVVVHHMRKQESEDPLDMISGSTAMQGAVDGFMLLYRKRGETDARLFVTGRDIEEEQELLLQFNQECATWTLKGDASENAGTQEQQAILDEMRAYGKPIALKDLANRLQKNVNTTRNLLVKLRSANKVLLQNNLYSVVTHSKHSNYSMDSNHSNSPKNTPEPYYDSAQVTTPYYGGDDTVVTPLRDAVEPSRDGIKPQVTTVTTPTTQIPQTWKEDALQRVREVQEKERAEHARLKRKGVQAS